jgi:hypothetical protein
MVQGDQMSLWKNALNVAQHLFVDVNTVCTCTVEKSSPNISGTFETF